MSILKYLQEELYIDGMYRLIEEFLLQESPEDMSKLKPLNFEHDNAGHYTFDVEYTENGEPKIVSMQVDIKTNCNKHSMKVTFTEKGGEYTTTNRGSTLGEKRKIVMNKMNGVAYCIGYHIENVPCEIDKIAFIPFMDDTDKERGTNRRANIYLRFIEKYLPKIGIEIKNIEHSKPFKKYPNVDYYTIYTNPFKGNEDGNLDIKDDNKFEHKYNEFIKEIKDLFDLLPDAPDDFKNKLKKELIQMFMNDSIEHLFQTNFYDLAKNVNEFFKYLNLKNEDWVNYTNNPKEIFNIAKKHNIEDVETDINSDSITNNNISSKDNSYKISK